MDIRSGQKLAWANKVAKGFKAITCRAAVVLSACITWTRL